ncbi:restriction endonuclease subunit S [Pseudomonadales bacterium]|nr:restriction endonuclease subunit S [Pseudomonadales bacterium]
MSEWELLELSEFITLQRGHDLPSDKRNSGDVPILGSSGITGYHDTPSTQGPGVTIGRSGNSMGVATYSKCDFFALNTTLFVKDFKGNDERFVYYWAKSFNFKSFDSGSAQSSLNRNFLQRVEVAVPPLREQRSIAELIGNLDDKIELNQRMNQTLEEIAKVIFKSWFVDFDPVRAKAEGRPTGLSPEISDQFPGELVDSEIGEIPKGWEVTSLGDVCEQVTKGTTPTSVGGKFSEDGNILFVKVESISEDGQLLPSKFAKIDEETDSLLKRSQLREGDVLLSIAGTIGRSTIMPKRFLPANTNQALAILRCCGKEDFVLQTLRSDHIQQNFHSKIVQAVQANLSLGEIKATQCVLPPLGVHDQLIDMIRKIREASEIRDQETSILAELRDTLLPKLISGELRIPDAEKFLEQAGI